MRFHERTAIITGANHGIGRACASLIAQEGAHVVFADNDKRKGQKAVAGLRERGADATFIHCDVGDKVAVDHMVKEAATLYGSIDVLINNAASIHHGTFLDMDESDFDRVVYSNLRGIFLVGQAVSKRMIRQTKEGGTPGVMVNIAAVSHMSRVSGEMPDIVSRGGLTQMTEVMAATLAPYSIRVNGIGPSNIIATNETSQPVDEPTRAKAAANAPLGRPGDPEEIARIALFLASDEAAYMTGQTVYPDGGLAALNDTI